MPFSLSITSSLFIMRQGKAQQDLQDFFSLPISSSPPSRSWLASTTPHSEHPTITRRIKLGRRDGLINSQWVFGTSSVERMDNRQTDKSLAKEKKLLKQAELQKFKHIKEDWFAASVCNGVAVWKILNGFTQIKHFCFRLDLWDQQRLRKTSLWGWKMRWE